MYRKIQFNFRKKKKSSKKFSNFETFRYFSIFESFSFFFYHWIGNNSIVCLKFRFRFLFNWYDFFFEEVFEKNWKFFIFMINCIGEIFSLCFFFFNGIIISQYSIIVDSNILWKGRSWFNISFFFFISWKYNNDLKKFIILRVENSATSCQQQWQNLYSLCHVISKITYFQKKHLKMLTLSYHYNWLFCKTIG